MCEALHIYSICENRGSHRLPSLFQQRAVDFQALPLARLQNTTPRGRHTAALQDGCGARCLQGTALQPKHHIGSQEPSEHQSEMCTRPKSGANTSISTAFQAAMPLARTRQALHEALRTPRKLIDSEIHVATVLVDVLLRLPDLLYS